MVGLRRTISIATFNMSKLSNNPREFAALRMSTLPLRPADVLIRKLHSTFTRKERPSSSVSFAGNFEPGFKPTARPGTEVEIARLEEINRNTNRTFDIGSLASPLRATKAREGGGGSISVLELNIGAASSAKRGGND